MVQIEVRLSQALMVMGVPGRRAGVNSSPTRSISSGLSFSLAIIWLLCVARLSFGSDSMNFGSAFRFRCSIGMSSSRSLSLVVLFQLFPMYGVWSIRLDVTDGGMKWMRDDGMRLREGLHWYCHGWRKEEATPGLTQPFSDEAMNPNSNANSNLKSNSSSANQKGKRNRRHWY